MTSGQGHRRKFFPNVAKCIDYFVTDDPNSIPWSEIMFAIINVLHLVIASFFILLAYTGVAWQSSLNSLEHGFKMTGDNLDLEVVTIIHHLIALLIIVLVMVGLNAASGGYEALLYCHMILLAIVLGLEMYISFMVGVRSDDCIRKYEVLKEILKKHVMRVYYDEAFQGFMDKRLVPSFMEKGEFFFISRPLYRRIYTSTLLMGGIEKAMGCCGYDSYYDYLNESSGVSGLRDPVDSRLPLTYVVPPSCCNSRFSSNIFCAANITSQSNAMLTKYEVESIINTEGCTIKLVELCNEIVRSWGRGIMFIGLVHIALFILSIPTVVIQVKILRKLSQETTFTFSIQHLKAPPIRRKDDDEAEILLDQKFQERFHQDENFVLNNETLEFLKELKIEHGIQDDYVYDGDELRRLPKTALVARKRRKRLRARKGPGPNPTPMDEMHANAPNLSLSPRGLLRYPSLILTNEDKTKLKEYQGRFNYFLNKQLLNYAAGVINSDPNAANAETLHDMHQAELVGKATEFYKQVLEAHRKKMDAKKENSRRKARRRNKLGSNAYRK